MKKNLFITLVLAGAYGPARMRVRPLAPAADPRPVEPEPPKPPEGGPSA